MDFREKVTQRAQERSGGNNLSSSTTRLYEGNDEPEYIVRSDFFGVENIRNPTSCLDLRLSDGTSKAVPYCYIIEMDFDPTDGIVIQTTNKKISIEGRNLKVLYNYLLAFRIKYIQANIGNDLTDEKKLFVKGIAITEI